MAMNRNKVLDKSRNEVISEFQDSLLIIMDSHSSNELIVNRLKDMALDDHQSVLCHALQKDMRLINDQLNTLLNSLNKISRDD
jgi:hypothetical protein